MEDAKLCRSGVQSNKIEVIFDTIAREKETWMKESSVLVDCVYAALGNGGIGKDWMADHENSYGATPIKEHFPKRERIIYAHVFDRVASLYRERASIQYIE